MRQKILYETLFWAHFIKNSDISSKYKNNLIYIWKAFDSIFGNNNIYYNAIKDIAMDPFIQFKEPFFLITVHLIILYCNDKIPENVDNNIEEYLGDEVIMKFLNRENILGVPDHAIDKHTRDGKNLGRDIRHFLHVGSVLVNVSTEWEQLDRMLKEDAIFSRGWS